MSAVTGKLRDNLAKRREMSAHVRHRYQGQIWDLQEVLEEKDREIADLKAEIEVLMSEHRTEIGRIMQKHNDEIVTITQKHNDEAKEMRRAHENEIEHLNDLIKATSRHGLREAQQLGFGTTTRVGGTRRRRRRRSRR